MTGMDLPGIDLPFIWAGIIAFAVAMYVLLDATGRLTRFHFVPFQWRIWAVPVPESV